MIRFSAIFLDHRIYFSEKRCILLKHESINLEVSQYE